MEWGNWCITHGFDALEQELAQTAGKYAYGDEVPAAPGLRLWRAVLLPAWF